MSKHTPAPWWAYGDEVHCRIVVKSMNCDPKITLVGPPSVGGLIPPEQLKANARLIAAAPELLAVLQELEESADYWSEYDVPIGIVQRIKNAIAKATS